MKVVVWDPSGAYPEGEFVDGQKAELLAFTPEVVALPAEPALMARNGAASWVRRAWGTGVRFDATTQRRGCGVALYVVGGHQTIHWTARIHAERPEARLAGMFRFGVDTSQAGTLLSGLGQDTPPVQLAELGEPDRFGGWTIGGRGRLISPAEGFMGLGLYGTMTGGRVLWLAVSQTN